MAGHLYVTQGELVTLQVVRKLVRKYVAEADPNGAKLLLALIVE